MMTKNQKNEDIVGWFYEQAGKQYDIDLDNTAEFHLRATLVLEEANELYREVADILISGRTHDKVHNMIKEIGDVLYTIYGFAGSLGIDPQVVFNRIANSNFSKLEGGVTKDAAGKVMKGPKYQPPDLTDLADELMDRQIEKRLT